MSFNGLLTRVSENPMRTAEFPFVLVLACSWLVALVLCASFAAFLGADPLQIDLSIRLMPPSLSHWLGTDELGRDLLSRLLHAASFTLWVTVAATLLSLTLGFLLGTVAAWFGHIVDSVIMAVVNVFWSIPFAIFAVLLIAVVGVSAGTLILAIGGVNWVTSARVFRTEMIRLRQSEFLRAARALGFPAWYILVRHALPNLRTTVINIAGYSAAETMTLESGLAFLGLSLPPPLPTWGGIMADGLSYLSTGWWISVLPAVAITITLGSLRVITNHAEQLSSHQ